MYIHYRRWGKFPWESGYKHLVEHYNIFQFIIAQMNIIRKKEEELSKEKKELDAEYDKLKNKVHKP
jgi:hypothetical protein